MRHGSVRTCVSSPYVSPAIRRNSQPRSRLVRGKRKLSYQHQTPFKVERSLSTRRLCRRVCTKGVRGCTANAVCWANHATLASHSLASADDDPACQPFLVHGFAPSGTPSKIFEMAPRKGAVGGGVLFMYAACAYCFSGVCVLHQRRVCVASAACVCCISGVCVLHQRRVCVASAACVCYISGVCVLHQLRVHQRVHVLCARAHVCLHVRTYVCMSFCTFVFIFMYPS